MNNTFVPKDYNYAISKYSILYDPSISKATIQSVIYAYIQIHIKVINQGEYISWIPQSILNQMP